MNVFFNVLKRECLRLKQNRFIMVILFIMPVFWAGIIMWTFIEGSAINLPIAVIDEDNSDISRTITRAVNSTKTCKITYKPLNIYEGQKLITGGKIYALLLIPREFKSNLNRRKQPQLVCYYNNQMILIGGLVSRDIQAAVLTVMGTAAAQIQMKKGVPKELLLTHSALISIDERVKSNPYLNYSYFLSYAGIAHAFQTVAVLLAVWAAGSEFKNGTTKEWLTYANNSIINAVFGKLIVYFSVLYVQIIGVYTFYVVLGIAPFEGNILFSVIGCGAFLFAYQMMGILFVTLTAHLGYAMSMGSVYVSLGFSFAGMTYPAFSMPLIAQIYSSFLPVRPFVYLVVDQAMREIPISYDMKYLIWILGISALGILNLPLLKKKLQNEKLWYRI